VETDVSIQTWREVLISQAVDGPAYTASTTPTSILHATAKYQFIPNYFYVGRKLWVRASGRVSNVVTTPGTLTLDLRVASGTISIASSGAMALNVVAKTNVPWTLEWELTVRAVGSGTSANSFHQGKWASESVIGSALPSAGGAGMHMLPNAAPAVGAGFDSSAAQILDLYATWSINNANSITVHQFELESSN
jgi:hypothetical protein